jgi:hypothetical protein
LVQRSDPRVLLATSEEAEQPDAQRDSERAGAGAEDQQLAVDAKELEFRVVDGERLFGSRRTRAPATG